MVATNTQRDFVGLLPEELRILVNASANGEYKGYFTGSYDDSGM